jgi:pyruvate formate lyase activating enzyme
VPSLRRPKPVRAELWEIWRGGPEVHCFLCAHHCRIAPGDRGLCGVRENAAGELQTLTYGCPVAAGVDPVEKKPLFHFLPGSLSYSIATVGCNFTCRFCQNAEISQMPRDQGQVQGSELSPDEVVRAAREAGCASISYTYTEPTIFMEYARDCASRATEAGLANVFVTNGYMTEEALDFIGGDLHAANVDLKAFSDEFYRDVVGARLAPVLSSIERLYERGVWLEVTTLLIPGLNDGEDDLRGLAGFLAAVSPDIPWHVSRFHPTYRMLDRPPTPLSSLDRAVALGREAGLHYIYPGNVPGHDGESTFCPECGERVIERRAFSLGSRRLDRDRCTRCGHPIPMVLQLAPDARGGVMPETREPQ